MKAYHWDELLEEEDLMDLTEEAMAFSAARRIPWMRLGTAAACLALILCLANYQALAAGVKRIVDYFSGVGAMEARQNMLIQSKEVEFSLSGRTYLISGAYARDGILFVPLEVVSKSEERLNESTSQNLYVKVTAQQNGTALSGQNPFTDLSNNGSYPYGQYTALERKRIPFSPLSEHPYLGLRYLEQGYQSYAQAVFTFELKDADSGCCTLSVEDYLTDTVQDVELRLAPSETIEVVSSEREVGEVLVTALVSKDGRSLSLYGAMSHEAEWWKSLVDLRAEAVYGVQFIGADGTCYQGVPRRSGDMAGYPQEILLTQDTGPITAVRIQKIYYAYDDMDEGLVSQWVELDWVIPLT